ncbi:DUF6660 family protein [Reichenbachiella sp. MALMAid0571]|uniref:DUF6660 family protein n=1 Tax=Reichenbachiella sp. MALMAid0571 TaxID=3143939 RepID=UPI0032DEDA9E
MKKIAAILAIFLLVLTLMPCSDTLKKDECGQEMHLHNQGDQDAHNELDLCSPFCSCACCGSTFIAKTKLFANTEFTSFQLSNTQYASLFYQEHIYNVFQPPRG